MDKPNLGQYRNSDGHTKPVAAVTVVNPDGSIPERNEHGLTPFEAKVIKLLAQIRDRLPEPTVAAKPAVKAEPKPKD